MTTYVFSRKPIQNDLGASYGKHELVPFESVEAVEQAVKNGDVFKIDDSLIQEYETKINNEWDKYQAQIKAIEETKDPALLIPGKQQFEIAQIKDERDKAIRLLRREYELKRLELLEDAKQAQLLTTTKYSSNDEELAKSVVERFETDALIDYISAKAVFNDTLEVMNDEQLAAMKTQIKRVSDVIKENEEDEKLAKLQINRIVDTIKYSDPVPVYDVLEAFPNAELIGTKVTLGRALEQAQGRHNSTHTELQRPSERYISETYGDISKSTADVGGNNFPQ